MILLVDHWNGRAVLLDYENKKVKGIKHEELVREIAKGSLTVDNVSLNSKGTDIICSSGSLKKAEDKLSIITVIGKCNKGYEVFWSKRIGQCGIEIYTQKRLRNAISYGYVFNAYFREGKIVIKGPIHEEKTEKLKASMCLSGVKRIDGKIEPTTFELMCNDKRVLEDSLIPALKKELNQPFLFGLNDGSDSVFDNMVGNEELYINFCKRHNIKYEIEIGMDIVESLMDYFDENMDEVKRAILKYYNECKNRGLNIAIDSYLKKEILKI